MLIYQLLTFQVSRNEWKHEFLNPSDLAWKGPYTGIEKRLNFIEAYVYNSLISVADEASI